MKKYPQYKVSGIDWIGQIPEHWEKNKLKYIGYLYSGLSGKSGEDFKKEDDPSNRPYINFTNICNNTYITKDNVGQVSIKEGEIQNRVEKGDLFFLMSSETQEDVGKSSVLKNEPGELYLNSFCKGFRLVKNGFDPNCINYILNGDVYRKLLSVDGKGFTRINLRQDKVNDFVFFCPSLPEQLQIVEFLDQKTSLIDTLIEKKLRKIELLKEQRTSIINHTVTKGLNPNVRMKDSGVEWIGEIPEHWGIGKLNQITSKLTNGFVGPTREIMKDSGIRYIQGIHIKNGEIKYTPDGFYYVSEDWSNDHKKSILKEGDVLVVQTGTIGEVGFVPKEFEGCNCHALIIIHLKEKYGYGKYLTYYIMSNYVKSFFRTIKTGEILEHLNTTRITDLKVCLPSISEQFKIVEYLDKKTTEIDTQISLENKKIDLLKEYRQSLISEVVTGKIDVRKN